MEFTHFDEEGRARMVNVGAKAESFRSARARCRVYCAEETINRIREGRIAKGDVLAVAQVAGIMAAKKVPDIIPMCHNLFLEGVDIRFRFPDYHSLIIEAEAYTSSKTGVEMEAITAVTVAALTVYDMVKAVDRFVTISETELIEKQGGKSGNVINPKAVRGEVFSISVNGQRGELKQPVEKARLLKGWGIEGDGHGGDWNRQVSLLMWEAVADLSSRYGMQVAPGEMAENILTRGIDLTMLAVGTRLKIGSQAVLRITQIGKEDHESVVTRRFGKSLIPRQGLFAVVEEEGDISPGDTIVRL